MKRFFREGYGPQIIISRKSKPIDYIDACQSNKTIGQTNQKIKKMKLDLSLNNLDSKAINNIDIVSSQSNKIIGQTNQKIKKMKLDL